MGKTKLYERCLFWVANWVYYVCFCCEGVVRDDNHCFFQRSSDKLTGRCKECFKSQNYNCAFFHPDKDYKGQHGVKISKR